MKKSTLSYLIRKSQHYVNIISKSRLFVDIFAMSSMSLVSRSVVTLPISTSEASAPASCSPAATTRGLGARCPPAACPGGRTALTATSAASSARSRGRTSPGGARAASIPTRRTSPLRPPATPSKGNKYIHTL